MPTGPDTPTAAAASSLVRPSAIRRQNPRSTSSRVQAATIASAPTDLLSPDEAANEAVVQLVGGTIDDREDLLRLASPITHVNPEAPPFLIAHGTLDETVPFSEGKRLYEALADVGVPVEFVPIEGGYHNWNPRREATWPDVRYFEFAYLALRFFQRHL